MSYNCNFCPHFHKAIELIGRRWSGAILREMLAGASRFTEIRGAIPEISDRMLSERLKELEAEGVVLRQVHADTPVRVEYLLTHKGRALEKVIASIGDWADEWLDRSTNDHPAA
ncbi:MAG: winged helix-turn-helix transcriptional regulator [Gemmatimonadales bacterium]|nr:winged helix-turn-helix transcriptional regulator [Gemmatimonadales bacterium]